jgi:hypothetical protein
MQGKKTRLHSTSNEDRDYRKASFRFLSTGQKSLLCCQSDVAMRKWTVLLNFVREVLDSNVGLDQLSWVTYFVAFLISLTLILLTWRIWRAPNNTSKWQMGFISAFNLQEPCVLYIGGAYRYPPDIAFYIFFSTNISTEYFKHAAHSPFVLFKMPFIS